MTTISYLSSVRDLLAVRIQAPLIVPTQVCKEKLINFIQAFRLVTESQVSDRLFARQGHVTMSIIKNKCKYKMVARNEKSVIKLVRLPILRLLLLLKARDFMEV